MKRHILVIDDDPAVRATLAAMLEERGYRVSLAENGERGLQAFRHDPPALVITDIVMPVKEGLQTIRELRAERPEVRIIAISAGARAGRHDFLAIARQLGVWDVAQKPFDPDAFVAQVESCLA